MKFYKVLISLLAISFAACGSDDTPNPNPPTPEPPISSNERTVLIYIAAENSLNKFSTDDLNEMKQGSRTSSSMLIRKAVVSPITRVLKMVCA